MGVAVLDRDSVSSAVSHGNDLAHTFLGVQWPSGYRMDGLATLVEAGGGKARLVALRLSSPHNADPGSS